MSKRNIRDKEIAEFLKQKRKEANLTQGEVAKKVGIPLETYSYFERGTRAFLNDEVMIYMKTCEVLDILPYALFKSSQDEQ